MKSFLSALFLSMVIVIPHALAHGSSGLQLRWATLCQPGVKPALNYIPIYKMSRVDSQCLNLEELTELNLAKLGLSTEQRSSVKAEIGRLKKDSFPTGRDMHLVEPDDSILNDPQYQSRFKKCRPHPIAHVELLAPNLDQVRTYVDTAWVGAMMLPDQAQFWIDLALWTIDLRARAQKDVQPDQRRNFQLDLLARLIIGGATSQTEFDSEVASRQFKIELQ